MALLLSPFFGLARYSLKCSSSAPSAASVAKWVRFMV